MEITPLNNRIILEQDDKKVTEKIVRAAGLIEQPDTVDNVAITAKVVAVGPGRQLQSGGRAPMEVETGDRVLIMANHVEPFQIKGKEYLFAWDSSVQVVLVE